MVAPSKYAEIALTDLARVAVVPRRLRGAHVLCGCVQRSRLELQQEARHRPALAVRERLREEIVNRYALRCGLRLEPHALGISPAAVLLFACILWRKRTYRSWAAGADLRGAQRYPPVGGGRQGEKNRVAHACSAARVQSERARARGTP